MTPEKLLELAGQAGFSVLAGHWFTEVEEGALTFSKKVGKGEHQEAEHRVAIVALEKAKVGFVQFIPTTASNPKILTTFSLGRDFDRARLGIAQVDPEFLEAVAQFAPAANLALERKEEFDRSFDAKVLAEIDRDREVQSMEADIEASKQRVLELEAGLIAKKEKLRREREEFRKSFRFLADDREL